MRVAVLYSGLDSADKLDEKDTIFQMEEVISYLEEMNMSVEAVPFTSSIADLEVSLKKALPDFVFNLVESVDGTDRLIYTAAALLENLRIPYTGCDVDGLYALSTKTGQKEMLRKNGLPTPDFITACGTEYFEGDWSGRFIVKSDSEHASVGLDESCIVDSPSLIGPVIEAKQKQYGGTWFAERYVEGREFNISLIGDGVSNVKVLPPAEMCFVNYPPDKPRIVDYEAKWEESSFAYNATVRSFEFAEQDRVLLDSLTTISTVCYKQFGLRGAARIDFRVDQDSRPWILEVNANPCLSSNAGFMAAAGQAGYSPSAVIKMLFPRGMG